jgi:hypothetical protein
MILFTMNQLPVAALLSVFKRSGCHLKILHLTSLLLHSEGLNILLQAMPSLERVRLSFRTGVIVVKTMMDNILARIFRPARGNSNTVEDPTSESFLPCLQFMECDTDERDAPFSWDQIPQLYHQGRQRSLVLKTTIKKMDITDETAIQLLRLSDKGLDLQIFDISIGGDFLQNFRKRMCEQSV